MTDFNFDDPKLLDEETSFDVHIGITEDYAEMFISQMEKLGIEVHNDEDGWEEWGGERGRGLNDLNTWHITLRFAKIQDAVTSAIEFAQKYINILVPFARQTQDTSLNGITVAVTLAGNWGERVLDVYLSESRTNYVWFRPQKVDLPWR